MVPRSLEAEADGGADRGGILAASKVLEKKDSCPGFPVLLLICLL